MITRRELLALIPLLITTPPAFVKVEDKKVREVHLRIIHRTEILKPLKKAKVWIPVPRSDHAQEIRDLKVSSPLPFRITEERVWGNMSVFLEGDPINPTTVEVSFSLIRKREAPSEKGPDPEMCLKPSEWEVWNREIEEFVDRVVGKERDPVKVARRLYDAIIERTKLIDGVCGRGVSLLTFRQRIGRCDEFHALYRSCLMYKGVPVSWEEGIVLPYPSQLKKRDTYEADCLKTISWVRFYDGKRWIPVDLAEAKRRPDLRDFYFGNIPPNRVRLSRGRGLRLEPPQREVLNIFAYTHIEEEGIPAIYGLHYRNTITYELVKVEVEG